MTGKRPEETPKTLHGLGRDTRSTTWLFLLIAIAAAYLLATDGSEAEASSAPKDRIARQIGQAAADPAGLLSPVGGEGQQSPGFRSDDTMLRASEPFVFSGSKEDRERAVTCLATAAWYEAGTDAVGQKAVMQVVLNRVRHRSFPSSICGVVFQGAERSTGCQFTFTCDGSRLRRQPSGRALANARRLALAALSGAVDPTVGLATHYHADYVAPWWSSQLQTVSKIGTHIFYSWRGTAGHLSRTYANATGEPSMPDLVQDRLPVAEPAIVEVPVSISASATRNDRAGGLLPSEYRSSRNSNLVVVDRATPSGRWAVDALNRCQSKASCVVIGYSDTTEVKNNEAKAAADMARPIFLFVRDASSGMDLPLWDCERVNRQSTAECLPTNDVALARLMRER